MKPAEPVVTVYGIANCDTVKKARAWLAEAEAYGETTSRLRG